MDILWYVVGIHTVYADLMVDLMDTLWSINITMERSTIFNGLIHYFYGRFQ